MSLNDEKASPDSPAGAAKSAQGMEHVEQINTNERVPGHDNYYEKNGLRTYGDDLDHDQAPKMTFKRMMSLIAMAFRRCSYSPIE